MNLCDQLIEASRLLADQLRPLHFSEPVTHTYLTLDYARRGHEAYLSKFARSRKRVLFLGMNPGPYGMAQTGVPFGEVAAVRDWMGLHPEIQKPAIEHPKRKVFGMDCPKSEVSGRRLWGLFAEKFPNAEDFFAEHFVLNFCPLVWMSQTGANITPDKVKASEMHEVQLACQRHLQATIEILAPEILIGVGGYAGVQMQLAKDALSHTAMLGKILHPSPASPAANRGWAEVAERQLKEMGVW